MKIDNAKEFAASEQWNNIRAFYIYAGTPQNPQLILNFELEISIYQPSDGVRADSDQTTDIPDWQRNAIDDKRRFTRLALRLDRNYDENNSAEISEPDVSMFLTNSLLKAGKTPLTPEDAQSFRKFIADCLNYVSDLADGLDGGRSPVCELRIPLSLNDISDFDLIKLSLALSFESSSIGGKENAVLSAQTTVNQIECDIEDLILSKQNEDDFTASFEGVFFDESWQMRLGATVPGISRPEQEEESIPDAWAVRIGKQPDAGFYFEIQNDAAFYAPKPIAGTLETATVPVGKYLPAELFPAETSLMVFSDIDLNAWINEAFSAIDSYLSTALETDSILSGNSEISVSLDKIRQLKQKIAGAVAATITPIFDSAAANDEISLAAAREKLRRLVADQLGNASIVSAVTVFKVSDVSTGRQKFSGAATPLFYGQFLKQSTSTAENKKNDLPIHAPETNYSLSEGQIQYFKSAELAGDWRLPLLFSVRNVELQAVLSIPLAYRLTHLESSSMITLDSQKAEQRALIRFNNKELFMPVGGVEFPVVSRALPAAPDLFVQTASAAAQMNAEHLTPSDLVAWNYSLNYGHQSSAQDNPGALIIFKEQEAVAGLQDSLHPLFAPLAQFITVYEDILKDFESATAEMKTSNRLNEGVENAKSASKAFAQIVESVADGYTRWINSSPETAVSGERPAVSCSFKIVLESGESGNARVDVINSISDSRFEPIIEFDSYKAVPAPDKPAYSLASYNYILSEPSQTPGNDESTASETHLSYEEALNISRRTIILKGLNVFTTQNVLGQLRVMRNATGKLEKINETFKFSSPTVKFAAPLVPSLRFADFDLGSLEVSGSTLENYLNAFFSSLLKDADDIPLLFRLTVSFSFDLSPSMTDSQRAVLPVTMIPGEIAVPQKDMPLSFVSELAKLMTNWTESTELGPGSNSEYNIRLEVFSGESGEQVTQMPLVAIDNLFIRTEKIISD